MTRRDLHPIPLDEVLPLSLKPERIITMSEGQWDGLLSAAYEQGWILLELDEREKPVRAYKKEPKEPNPWRL